MPADPRLLALPALRKLAEEQAREFYSINVTVGTIRLPTWSDMIPEAQALAASSFLALLSDLTRPASRDAVARLVAAKARIKVYALHALLVGAIPYPPEWSTDLCDRVAAAESEGEALTLIALAVFGGSDGE